MPPDIPVRHAMTETTMQRVQEIATTAASLLPEELLIVAGSHEHQEMERYQLLALRFLPFSTGVSHLMKMLALECDQRLEALARVAGHLQLGTLPRTEAAYETRVRDSHFFIVDNRMASQALAQALVGEHRSLHFYRQMQEVNATPEVHSLLTACIRQKQAQECVLEESQEQLLIPEHAFACRRSA